MLNSFLAVEQEPWVWEILSIMNPPLGAFQDFQLIPASISVFAIMSRQRLKGVKVLVSPFVLSREPGSLRPGAADMVA